ncbi:MAG TPA: hypothetical protein VFY85_07380 [Gemmatimonadaceae bacterium]|nr:hypothetical protein [Gemmatimonadaceae bacterium]
MPPLAALPAARHVCGCLLVVVASLAATSALGAQAPLSHTEDAAPVAAGTLRLGITTAWTRYDERFAAAGGTEPLSADLSTPALGVAQLPLLAPTEASLQALAGDPAVRLSLGRLEVRGGARIVTTPVSLEYGVTRRLSVGVQVPIVQTRRVVQLRVNEDTSVAANMGFVPAGSRADAAQRNQTLVTAFRDAADQLATLITQCAANPGASGCGPVNADPAGAAAARDQARAYANAAAVLGTDASQALLAPRAGSALATSIDARRQAINLALQQYLGAGAGANAGVFLATTNFSYVDLQGRGGTPGLLQSAVGGGLDSLHTSDRLGIGDVAVGAKYLLFDRFARGDAPLPRLQARMLVGAAIRFATSPADSARDLVDIAPGEGAGVELHSALDLISGRFGGTIAARYVKAFARTVTAPLYGDPEASFPFPAFGQRSRTAGDVIGLDVSPRYFFSDWLSVDAHYGLERVGATTWSAGGETPCANCAEAVPAVLTTVGAATTAQRLGVGFRLSTVNAYARQQARFPIEVSFVHLETVTGAAGLPKASRDQIQLRIFYRLRRAD